MNERTASVSVVVPCYRCSETIARAVDSVARQTVRPLEIILVDDCSADQTVQELHRLKTSYDEGWIKIVECDVNRGPAAARNIGWDLAAGRYVAFLDADDSWHLEKIETQFLWMEGRPDVALSGHACEVAQEPSLRSFGLRAEFEQVLPSQLLLSNCFLTPSVMLRRELPQRFDQRKRFSEDYLLWLTLCLDGNQCFRTPEPLAFLHKAPYGHSGLSGNLAKMEAGELHVYWALAKAGRIGALTLPWLWAFSLLKFARRVVKVGVRNVLTSARA